MITSKCPKHPKYEGKGKPLTCKVCWSIYRKVHNIAGR